MGEAGGGPRRLERQGRGPGAPSRRGWRPAVPAAPGRHARAGPLPDRLGDLYATSPRAVGLTLFVNGFNSVRLEWYQRLPPEWRALEPLLNAVGAVANSPR